MCSRGDAILRRACSRWRATGSGFCQRDRGQPPPGELVGSTLMTDLIEELESKFDLVIIDTPTAAPGKRRTDIGGEC